MNLFIISIGMNAIFDRKWLGHSAEQNGHYNNTASVSERETVSRRG